MRWDEMRWDEMRWDKIRYIYFSSKYKLWGIINIYKNVHATSYQPTVEHVENTPYINKTLTQNYIHHSSPITDTHTHLLADCLKYPQRHIKTSLLSHTINNQSKIYLDQNQYSSIISIIYCFFFHFPILLFYHILSLFITFSILYLSSLSHSGDTTTSSNFLVTISTSRSPFNHSYNFN